MFLVRSLNLGLDADSFFEIDCFKGDVNVFWFCWFEVDKLYGEDLFVVSIISFSLEKKEDLQQVY